MKNKIALLLSILTFILPFTANAALTTNLVSYWNLDGNSNDSVGTNNGSDTSVTYSSGNGKIVQGAGFNGSSSKIDLVVNSLNYSQPMTVAAWVKTSSASSGEILSTYNYTGGGNYGWQCAITATGKAILDVRDSVGTDYQATGATSINDGNWHYVVCLWNGTTGSVYIDGNSTADGTGTMPTASSWPYGYATIGAAKYNSSLTFQYYTGNIDEVGIWNRALSTSEMSQLYNSGAGFAYPFGVTTTIGSFINVFGWW